MLIGSVEEKRKGQHRNGVVSIAGGKGAVTVGDFWKCVKMWRRRKRSMNIEVRIKQQTMEEQRWQRGRKMCQRLSETNCQEEARKACLE